MKRFKFKLQTVLDVKKRREEAIEEELSQLRALWEQQKESLALLEEKQLHYQTSLRSCAQAKLQIQSIQQQLEYLKFIADEIFRQQEELTRLACAMEQKRISLLAASQERQLLEQVKKKGQQAYIREYRREEQNFLDELAQFGFCRKEAGLHT